MAEITFKYGNKVIKNRTRLKGKTGREYSVLFGDYKDDEIARVDQYADEDDWYYINKKDRNIGFYVYDAKANRVFGLTTEFLKCCEVVE